MATDDQATPRGSVEDWLALESACSSSAFARCLIELRDCFLDELRGRGWPGEIPSVAATPAQPTTAPAPGGEGGLTVEQLAECLPGNAWQNSPEGYSRLAFARHLLAHPVTGPRLRAAAPAAAPAGGVTKAELVDCLPNPFNGDLDSFARRLLNHPRIGPLLRGKRVVLTEKAPLSSLHSETYANGYRDGWDAAHAEVARQQGEQP